MDYRTSTRNTRLKLIGSFLLFGVIVGLGSILANTILTGRNIAKSTAVVISRLLDDWLLEDNSTDDPHNTSYNVPMQRVSSFLNALPPDFPYRNVELRLFDAKEDDWHLHRLDENNKGQEALNTEQELNHYRGILPQIIPVQPHTLVRVKSSSSSLEWMTRLTPFTGHKTVLLSMRFSRIDQWWNQNVQNWRTFAFYGLLISILSYILATIFSWKQTRSLRRMSEKAAHFAQGDYSISFLENRRDTIGHLSRNLDAMAMNLRKQVATMTTMNRIDRAVLSVESQNELTSTVAGYISEQFNQAQVAVLELEGGIDNRVLRMVGASDPEAPSWKLPLDQMPPGLRDELASRGLLDSECLDVFRQHMPLWQSNHRGARIPLFIEKRLSGALVVSLPGTSSPDWDTLEALSDQVGVALLHMRQEETREAMYRGSLNALSASVDASSKWTAGHSDRVAVISDRIAVALYFDRRTRRTLEFGAKLHDIGKISVDKKILDKPSKLTKEEFDIIKAHPAQGEAIVRNIPGLDEIRDIILFHHERWDGSGYPQGRRKEDIPILARLVCIADVFESITADRPYRKTMSRSDARAFMESQSGKIFDPGLLKVFLTLFDQGLIPMEHDFLKSLESGTNDDVHASYQTV